MSHHLSRVPPAVPWPLIDKTLRAIHKCAPTDEDAQDIERIWSRLSQIWETPLDLEDQHHIYKEVFDAAVKLRENRGTDENGNETGSMARWQSSLAGLPVTRRVLRKIAHLEPVVLKSELLKACDSVVDFAERTPELQRFAERWRYNGSRTDVWRNWNKLSHARQASVLTYLDQWRDGDQADKDRLSVIELPDWRVCKALAYGNPNPVHSFGTIERRKSAHRSKQALADTITAARDLSQREAHNLDPRAAVPPHQPDQRNARWPTSRESSSSVYTFTAGGNSSGKIPESTPRSNRPDPFLPPATSSHLSSTPANMTNRYASGPAFSPHLSNTHFGSTGVSPNPFSASKRPRLHGGMDSQVPYSAGQASDSFPVYPQPPFDGF